MAGKRAITGRAKTVLVFGPDSEARAVVSTVVARVSQRSRRKRLAFSGSAIFEPSVIKHLTEDILATVDRIAHQLGPKRKPKAFVLSVVNLGAASVADVGLRISGFSADAAAFVALLSAILKISLPQDIVATGHVASPDGDIRPVRGIPTKLAAAIQDPAIQRFVVPSLDADGSLSTLSPVERERTADAITNAKGELRIAQVANVYELVQEVFDNEAVILGSLRSDFFELDGPLDELASPVGRTVDLLSQGNEKRFWRVLESHLFAGCAGGAQELLLARARYQVRRKRYPRDFGRKLLQLVRSLPPATRRTDGLFPLLPRGYCLRIFRFTREENHEDVEYLLKAAAGNVAEPPWEPVSISQPIPSAPHTAVEAVLAEISAESLAKKIGIRADSARATFLIGDVVLDSDELFRDTVSSFYLALLRHTGSERATRDDQTVLSESFALLERAFADKGGADAARAEARHGIHGGMRFVLDVMTERYKTELQINHVKRIVAEAVDPLDWNERVAFMDAFLERLGPQLPDEIRAQPPERFARHYGLILENYVQSLDRVRQLLRTL